MLKKLFALGMLLALTHGAYAQSTTFLPQYNLSPGVNQSVSLSSALPVIFIGSSGTTAGYVMTSNGPGVAATFQPGGSGSGTVTSVASAGGTLTITNPTSAVNADINLANPNVWTAAQTFPTSGLLLQTSAGGTATFVATASGNSTITFPNNNVTVATLNLTQTFAAGEIFSSSATFSGLTQATSTTCTVTASRVTICGIPTTVPSFGTTNGGALFMTAAGGAGLSGAGTTYDSFLADNASAVALGVLHGTTNLSAVGSFGIGTSSPIVQLDVYGTTSTVADFTNSAALGAASGAGVIGDVSLSPTAAGQRLGFLLFGSRAGGNGAGVVGWSDGAWTGSTSNPAYITFETAPNGSGTRVEHMRITSAGHIGYAGTTPTVSSCGTSPTIDSTASDNTGTVNIGSGVTASCTITFATAFTTYNHCVVASHTTAIAVGYSYTLSAITVTGSSIGSGVIDYLCNGN